MANITGAQLVAQALVDRGIPYVFTLSGGHITPIHQYLDESEVTIFDTRHEQAAVFMAEAWGKMTRTAGVAMVTAGPGFTNALTGIASASFSNTPLILIAGSVGLDNREKLDLQDMPQEAVIAPMVKKTFVCPKAERAYEYVDMAFRTAMSGRPGPVYLEIPVDVLNKPVQTDGIKKISTTPGSQPADPDKVHLLLEMISSAQKPVIIAGTGIWQAGAEKELVTFSEKTGIPVFTSLGGRGTIPDTHPLCFEGAIAIRPGASLYAYMSTDLLIVLGTRISLYYMFGDIFNPAAKMVQVDICPEEIGRNKQVDLPVVSDLKGFLGMCNRIISQKQIYHNLPEKFTPWISELNKAASDSKEQAEPNWSSNAVPIHPMRLAKEIDLFMDKPDDIVVAWWGVWHIIAGLTTAFIFSRRPLPEPPETLSQAV